MGIHYGNKYSTHTAAYSLRSVVVRHVAVDVCHKNSRGYRLKFKARPDRTKRFADGSTAGKRSLESR